MNYLVDTNLLVRRLQPDQVQHSIARRAIELLWERGDQLTLVPQVIVELWAVLTRPSGKNGLGLSPEQAAELVTSLEAEFLLWRDTAEIYDEWKQLVQIHAVSGLKVYDARLVAAMRVYGLAHILTFNKADFRRYPAIIVLDPEELVGPEL